MKRQEDEPDVSPGDTGDDNDVVDNSINSAYSPSRLYLHPFFQDGENGKNLLPSLPFTRGNHPISGGSDN